MLSVAVLAAAVAHFAFGLDVLGGLGKMLFGHNGVLDAGSPLVAVTFVVNLVAAAVSGVLGLRASRHRRFALPASVAAAAWLTLSVVGIGFTVFVGGVVGSVPAYVCNIAAAILCVFLGLAVNAEA
ncbi:MAG: hypothetical protein LIV25_07520 [Olsenella sp.]|nr:hypothetical protein [Olsenella sp.]